MDFLYYAAYGSNLHPLRLRRRVPSATSIGTCRIDGWAVRWHKRSNVDGSGKCNLVRSTDASSAFLAVYRITPRDRSELDRCEGLGQGYDQIDLELPGFGRCFAYAAAGSHIDDSLLPYDWYREMVVLGCRANGFPAAYTAQLARQAALPDSNRRRRRRQWTIVEELRSGQVAKEKAPMRGL